MEGCALKELLRTNDPVRLSWLTALLADARIEAVILDTHTSVLEGSIWAIQRRLVVVDEEYARARRVLIDAGESLPEPDNA
jgi:Putative prokaryotic signal transducing protein